MAVLIERNHVGGVDEGKAQIFGHHARGEVFAAADDVFGREIAALGAFAEYAEFVADGIIQIEFFGDFAEALTDSSEQVVAGHVVLQVRVDQIQKIGDLAIGLIALARGGNHDEPTGRIGLDDLLHLLELLGGADARAAELRYLDHILPTFDSVAGLFDARARRAHGRSRAARYIRVNRSGNGSVISPTGRAGRAFSC